MYYFHCYRSGKVFRTYFPIDPNSLLFRLVHKRPNDPLVIYNVRYSELKKFVLEQMSVSYSCLEFLEKCWHNNPADEDDEILPFNPKAIRRTIKISIPFEIRRTKRSKSDVSK